VPTSTTSHLQIVGQILQQVHRGALLAMASGEQVVHRQQLRQATQDKKLRLKSMP
jgi:hypothetical protein